MTRQLRPYLRLPCDRLLFLKIKIMMLFKGLKNT